jgi:hypothetical protein
LEANLCYTISFRPGQAWQIKLKVSRRKKVKIRTETNVTRKKHGKKKKSSETKGWFLERGRGG